MQETLGDLLPGLPGRSSLPGSCRPRFVPCEQNAPPCISCCASFVDYAATAGSPYTPRLGDRRGAVPCEQLGMPQVLLKWHCSLRTAICATELRSPLIALGSGGCPCSAAAAGSPHTPRLRDSVGTVGTPRLFHANKKGKTNKVDQHHQSN